MKYKFIHFSPWLLKSPGILGLGLSGLTMNRPGGGLGLGVRMSALLYLEVHGQI